MALEMRDRLERIRPDRDVFLAKLKAERSSIYKVTLIMPCYDWLIVMQCDQ